MNSRTNSKIKLTYYFDALCGWCYGFSSVMSKLEKEYHDVIDFEVISGGLFLGNRVGSVNVVAPHIKAGAYRNVELRTGVQFGETFLKDVFGEGKMTLNSLPPSMALCIVKEKYPKQKLKFAKILLDAVYRDGVNPIDVDSLSNYAATIGFDEKEFKSKMKEVKYQNAAEEEFKKFKNSPMDGMPAIVLETEESQILLANGYTDFEELKLRLEQVLLKN